MTRFVAILIVVSLLVYGCMIPSPHDWCLGLGYGHCSWDNNK
jgi:hypothetical protein